MRYRFGHFELIEKTRELLANGQPRPIEPQVFDLVAYLVRERGRVVPLDDLINAIWDGRIVSNSAVSARISAARSVLDDDGVRQQWIRTVPRRGFRFVGDVENDEGDEARPPEQSGQSHRQRVAFCRSADGTQIAYATSGEGYPLVKAGHWLTHLEHDWHSPIWRPFLDRLNARYRVIRYDQRGNGLSDWDIGDLAIDRFVEDLEAVVESAGIDRFALYASSQGVPVAIAFARRHPNRISHLVLQGGYEQGRLVRGSESERSQAEAILTLIRHGWGKRGSPFIDAFATMFVPGGNHEQVASLAELQRQTTSPENAAALRAAIDRFDVSDVTGKVDVPTMVIHARDDGVQPFEQGRLLASRIPGAEFLMLESRNHIILPQEPAWPVLFDEIDRFIDRQ